MNLILSSILSLFGFSIDPMKPAREAIENFKIQHSDRIHHTFADAGDVTKRPVIFIHGSPGSKEGWYAYLYDSSLSKRYHLISIDRPGYRKDDDGRSERSLTKQAELIWDVLKNNKSNLKPILVGHSFGGAVIAKIAMIHKEEIHGLVFVASSVDPQLEKVKLIQRIGDSWGIRSLVPDHLRVCNEEILALKNELQIMKDDWSLIKAKVIVIHGEKDDLVPVDNVKFLQNKLKIHKTYLLENVNHFIPWNYPEVIKQAIMELG